MHIFPKSPHLPTVTAAAACLVCMFFLSACLTAERAKRGTVTGSAAPADEEIVSEMQRVLDDEYSLWYPIAIDTADGGFFSDINERWEREGSQDKMIVTQARHVWSTAQGAQIYQKDHHLRDVSSHGVRFLRIRMWDRQFGGFYDLTDRRGNPITEDGQIVKRAYGMAFAIYGLAAYYRTSGDTSALRLAQETFRWLDTHSYDSLSGGYYQFLSRDGVPMKEGYRETPPKDQNSTIHLLEAFTELYRVWPNDLVRERLLSLMHLVRDRITSDRGTMTLFFRRDWTPVSYRDSSSDVREKNYYFDHVSFGHDIETAYLLLDASDALGLNDDSTTLSVSKKMVDHALRTGWDDQHGGIFDGGYYLKGEDTPTIVRRTKEWWAQAEALNSFLLMSDLFPADSVRYYEKFRQQWEYCKRYLLDPAHGGWYWGGSDAVPQIIHSPKGTIWKCNYHTSRALMNCITRLKARFVFPPLADPVPVNTDCMPEARKLLEDLYSISGKRIISGHHNYVGRIDTYPNRVKELTGKLPEVWGCDFINYYTGGDAQTIVEEATKKYREGYIITLMWHAGRPQDDPPFGWKESIQGKLTDQEWGELTTPGSPLNLRWQKQVDIVAGYLKQLEARGVPVLWRPYHELNGVWFWWGNRKGPNGSAKLYRMMFDRYVHHHLLNNLLWVWNTNAPRQLDNDEAYGYEDFFPGLDCVDVLATDIYHSDYRQSHHDDLVRIARGKIVALGEIGEVPPPNVLNRQPRWTWFMVWGDFVDTHNTPEAIRALYASPRVLTHEHFFGND